METAARIARRLARPPGGVDVSSTERVCGIVCENAAMWVKSLETEAACKPHNRIVPTASDDTRSGRAPDSLSDRMDGPTRPRTPGRTAGVGRAGTDECIGTLPPRTGYAAAALGSELWLSMLVLSLFSRTSSTISSRDS